MFNQKLSINTNLYTAKCFTENTFDFEYKSVSTFMQDKAHSC